MITRQISDYYLADIDPEGIGIDTFSANLYDLLSAFQSVLTRAGREAVHEVFGHMISMEERTEEIKRILSSQPRILFSELFNLSGSRNLLIVTFLVVLEMVRIKFARVLQERPFGEIVIEKAG